MKTETEPRERSEPLASTGVAGLDDVLAGGLPRDRLYLIEGVPGSGKTTLALQFLMEGVRRGESGLYVTLSETGEELRAVADSHGWSLDGIGLREMMPGADNLLPDEQYSMFHPSEIELGQTTKTILADVEQLRPQRVVLDSLSELRLLSANPLRYRRQILALKQFFGGRSCTVLLIDDLTSTRQDLQVQSLAHGVIRLEQLYPEYGAERRRMIVMKLRGVPFRGGYHDFAIRRGGLEVFPRLVASERVAPQRVEKLESGLPALDSLLGGGVERGTSTLLVGAAGTGKSSIAAQFVAAAAGRGQGSAMFLFDESLQTLLSRCDGLGIRLRTWFENGRVAVQRVEPADLSPGEFAQRIRRAVEERDVSLIVIDSLNGYLNAMPGERFLVIHLHELLMYLGQQGVATILVGAHQGLIGTSMVTPVDATYLADAVVLLRYYEARGRARADDSRTAAGDRRDPRG